MKKIICIICVLLISFSGAFAQENVQKETQNIIQENVIESLPQKYGIFSALGIADEAELKSDLDSYVSRANAAVILCKLFKLSSIDIADASYSFKDVMPEVSEEIDIYTAVEYGLLKPKSATHFYPAYPVKRDELAEALLTYLGYDRLMLVKKISVVANDLGLLNNVKSTGNLTKSDFYTMLYNALFIPVAKIDGINDNGVSYQVSRNENLLSLVYDIFYEQGIITMAGGVDLSSNTTTNENQIKINGITFFDDEPIPAKDYLGRKYICYYYKENGRYNIVYLEDKNNRTISLSTQNKLSYDNLTYTSENGKDYVLENPYIIKNESIYTGAYTSSNLVPQNGEVILIENNGNSYFDIVLIYDYKDYFVKQANEDLMLVTDYLTAGPSLSNSKDIVVYNDGGAISKLNDIAEKTVVSVLENSNKVVLYSSSKTIEGSISEISTENSRETYTIENNKYYISKYLKDALLNNDISPISFNKTYIFYFNIFNEIVYYEEGTGLTDKLNYGVVTKVSKYNNMSNEPFKMRIFSKRTGGFQDYVVADKIILNGVSGCKHDKLYKAMLKDGQTGSEQASVVPQIIEFKVNDDEKITEVMQVGNPDSNKKNLYVAAKSLNDNILARAYREILVSYRNDGEYWWDNTDTKKNIQFGYSLSYTESLQIPYDANDKIAADNEDLFSVKAIPRASGFKGIIYKKNPDDVMADFVALYTSASSTSLNCGTEFNIAMVSDIKKIYKDDEIFTAITTEKNVYYVDSAFDVNNLTVYDKNGTATAQKHKLQKGDIINVVADANYKVKAIEPLYDYENNCFLGTTNPTIVQSRDGQYNLRLFKVNKFNKGYLQLETINGSNEKYLTKRLSSEFYFDPKASGGSVRKAEANDFISESESSDKYTIVIIYQRYNDPQRSYSLCVER